MSIIFSFFSCSLLACKQLEVSKLAACAHDGVLWKCSFTVRLPSWLYQMLTISSSIMSSNLMVVRSWPCSPALQQGPQYSTRTRAMRPMVSLSFSFYVHWYLAHTQTVRVKKTAKGPIPWSWSYDSCGLPSECWELNPDPLEEQLNRWAVSPAWGPGFQRLQSTDRVCILLFLAFRNLVCLFFLFFSSISVNNLPFMYSWMAFLWSLRASVYKCSSGQGQMSLLNLLYQCIRLHIPILRVLSSSLSLQPGYFR